MHRGAADVICSKVEQSLYNDSSKDIYLEVTQMTIIICLPVGRHSCNERSGHESGVKLHDAPTVLTSTADNLRRRFSSLAGELQANSA